MPREKLKGSLTAAEKQIVKALLSKGWRNQDIQALVNTGRKATINSARITAVKQNPNQKVSTDDEVEFYHIKKRAFDPRTQLNLYDDERLIRAREAMILAVQVFNSPAFNFKAGMFSVVAYIAWTYLLHEYYQRKGVDIIGADGRSLLLSQMTERQDWPLSDGARNNLRALKAIRDDVEHKLLGKADTKWLALFQACCLNFDGALRKLFGELLTLSNDLAFALQFNRLNVDQLAVVNKYEIPENIEALDARLTADMSDQQIADLEYQFRVVYTLDASSKAKAHFEFVRPDSAEGKEIRNVLVNYKPADELYPHKPQQVVKLVSQKTGKRFTTHSHVQAWHALKIRPPTGSKQPANTNKEFCIYHASHGDYTYSEKWINRLVDEVNDEHKFADIKLWKP